MSLPDSFRAARTADHDAIDALLRAAFPTGAEAALTRDLRASGLIETEIVMPWGPGIVGFLALSRLAAPQGWLALAPVAIDPVWQTKRLGSRLVAGALKLAAIKGQTIVVLGKPSFYTRAGFSHPRAAGLTAPYPATHLLIARPGADVPAETLVYPAAFAGV